MADTIRLQCLHAIQATLTAMTPPAPRPAFSEVRIGPLLEQDGRKRMAAGIVAGKETKKTEYPLMDCTLPIEIELRFTYNSDDDGLPAEGMERMIGDVQKALAQDYTLGGLAVDFRDEGNEQQLNGWLDKSVMAVLYYTLRYRHSILDPTQPV